MTTDAADSACDTADPFPMRNWTVQSVAPGRAGGNSGPGCRTTLLSTVSIAGLGLPSLALASGSAPVPPLESGPILPLHPVCVHFAVALVVFGVLLDCAGSLAGNRDWQHAGRLGLFAGVGGVGLAVLSGWLERRLPQPDGAFDAQIRDLVWYHEYGGYLLFGFFLLLAAVRLQIRERLPVAYMLLAFAGVCGLGLQGYWGGELVYRYGAGVRAVHVLTETLQHRDTEAAGSTDG